MMSDGALKRAQLSKIRMETLIAALTVLVYAQFLLSDDVKYRIRQGMKRWRSAVFGPPPMTEEQIQEAERQVIVEALRTVRSGE